MSNSPDCRCVAVIGGGPAGLMAAEALARHGVQVDVYDAMPSVGRKFLMAGKGGMNITHSEPLEPFLARYGKRRPQLTPLLNAFGPDALRAWLSDLGVETFVRQLRPRLSHRHEGRADAARLAASVKGIRRAVSHAAQVDRLGVG